MVELIADGLLLFATLGAAAYCYFLSKKLGKLNQFETGLGGAIAVLSAQVDDMQKALEQTEDRASKASDALEIQIKEAQEMADKLELLLASMDDLETPSRPHEPLEEKLEPGAFSTRRQVRNAS